MVVRWLGGIEIWGYVDGPGELEGESSCLEPWGSWVEEEWIEMLEMMDIHPSPL